MSLAYMPDVAVEGIIGAGKTTLLDRLRSDFRSGAQQPFCEPVDEPVTSYQAYNILEENYKDPKKNAFVAQTHILNVLYLHHQCVQYLSKESDLPILTERSFFSPLAFISTYFEMGYISETEHHVLKTLWHRLFWPKTSTFSVPKKIFFLDVPPEVCLERIRIRNRPGESTITLEFLQCLRKNYRQLLLKYALHHGCPVVWMFHNKTFIPELTQYFQRTFPRGRRERRMGWFRRSVCRLAGFLGRAIPVMEGFCFQVLALI